MLTRRRSLEIGEVAVLSKNFASLELTRYFKQFLRKNSSKCLPSSLVFWNGYIFSKQTKAIYYSNLIKRFLYIEILQISRSISVAKVKPEIFAFKCVCIQTHTGFLTSFDLGAGHVQLKIF